MESLAISMPACIPNVGLLEMHHLLGSRCDSHTLVALGDTELGMGMDWNKSSPNQYMCINRKDDKGKQVYIPSVFNAGFYRGDVPWMVEVQTH